MRVETVMTRDPVCCTPDTGLREVAQMMVEHDCGQIPLVRSTSDPTVLGVVTDRDIVSRLVAQGRNPLDQRADTCMSQPAITVSSDASVEKCIQVMEAHRIRRVPVVDGNELMRGIVSQADIARHAPHASTGELVREVSQGRRFENGPALTDDGLPANPVAIAQDRIGANVDDSEVAQAGETGKTAETLRDEEQEIEG